MKTLPALVTDALGARHRFSGRWGEVARRFLERLARRRSRRLLAAVKAERKKSFALFEQAPVAISVYEGPPDYRIVVFNEKSWEMLGKHRAKPRPGQPLLDAIPELWRSVPLEVLNEVYRTGRPQSVPEHRVDLRREDGTLAERYFANFCHPIQDERGTVTFIMNVGYEVTEQVFARRQLSFAREAAESANRAKDEFLAMLGHELRNPLAPILTTLQLMRLRRGQSRELDVLDRQVAHLTRLVNDLLDVSRVTSGKVELHKKNIEIASVVTEAIETASPLFEQRRHRLEVDVPPSGAAVHGDLDRLAQVISNLLTNAAKYSSPGSRILLHAFRHDGWVRVTVQDEGVGIAPDMLPRIFDPFVQERQTLDRSRGGLGLGLAIVRTLVQAHGGRVWARSQGLGKGSEFTVELPAVDVRPDHVRGSLTGPQSTAQPGAARILVVDDNWDAAETLRDALEELGYDVRVAHDGPSALEAFSAFSPDLALLDIGLPVMDGYELAERLLEAKNPEKALHLIAVTGYGLPSDHRRSEAAGFERHLVKPVDLAALECAVRSALSGKAA